jgi:hypothetical protein
MAIPKKVWQYNAKTGMFVREFNSLSDAGRAVGCHPSNVRHGIVDDFAVKGYYWKWSKGKRLLKVPIKTERFNPRSKPVKVFKNGKLLAKFNSTHAASEAVGLKPQTLRSMIKGKRPSGVFSAEYVNPADLKRMRNHGGGAKIPVPVIAKKANGKIYKKFKSIGEAARITKVKNISLALKGVIKTAGGYVWERAK